MKLKTFGYKTAGWEVNEVGALHLTNLLVGENSSGKTRILRAIQNTASLIQMKPMLLEDYSFSVKLEFTLPEKPQRTLRYSFAIQANKVIDEQLRYKGRTVIARSHDTAILNGDNINPPADKLIIQVRRDKTLYPEIERLILWAEGVVTISMSNLNPVTIFGSPFELTYPYRFSDLVKELTTRQKREVLREARSLGYYIKELDTISINDNLNYVHVKERYAKNSIVDFQLSNGFLRTLYLLCFISQIGSRISPSLLLIDDLGEGLDYSRVKKLGSKIFDTCHKKGLQLIASSNDAFLMDETDISKWQVLTRKNSKIKVLNRQNSEQLFNEFKETGLNNFDFFSSNYIEQFNSPAPKP